MDKDHKEEGWKTVPKQYFLEDPVRDCFVEQDDAIAGNPIWPYDDEFSPDTIDRNITIAREMLNEMGGELFASHVRLNPNRTVDQLYYEDKPIRLETTFVSGFLIPDEAIIDSKLNFYPIDGTIPRLDKTLNTFKGTWLISNLGFFLTRKLIIDKSEGGLEYSHNSRHPADEKLPEDAMTFLGGFFVREGNRFIGYPPLFGTTGVGVTNDGKVEIIDDIEIKGGTVKLNDVEITWLKDDVNPTGDSNSNLKIYTPAYKTPTTEDFSRDRKWLDYRPMIGEGRINVVVVNVGTGIQPEPNVAYIKDGSIQQPVT